MGVLGKKTEIHLIILKTKLYCRSHFSCILLDDVNEMKKNESKRRIVMMIIMILAVIIHFFLSFSNQLFFFSVDDRLFFTTNHSYSQVRNQRKTQTFLAAARESRGFVLRTESRKNNSGRKELARRV